MHLGYNLTWDSFPEHLGSIFQDLSKSNRFSDITLVCDDQKLYKSHKFILSASSDVFKAIFSNETQSPPMIYLRGVSHIDLALILSFVYTGQVTFEQERLSEFLKTAKDLKIYGIEQKTDNTDELNIKMDSEEDNVDSSKEYMEYTEGELTEMLPLDSNNSSSQQLSCSFPLSNESKYFPSATHATRRTIVNKRQRKVMF